MNLLLNQLMMTITKQLTRYKQYITNKIVYIIKVEITIQFTNNHGHDRMIIRFWMNDSLTENQINSKSYDR